MTTAPRPRTVAVILAAGLGTRMRSRTPKLLHPICGRPMLAWVLDVAGDVSGARPLVVYSPPTAAICEAFADDADFALQDVPRGTADAVRAALDVLPADVTEILVLNGDVPLMDLDLVRSLAAERSAAGSVMALVTVDAKEARRSRPRGARRGRPRGPHRGGEGRHRPRSWHSMRSTPASTPSTWPGCESNCRGCGHRALPVSCT